jgi:hypothetical protein
MGTYGVIIRRMWSPVDDLIDPGKIRSVSHFVVCTALIERVVSCDFERGDYGWLQFHEAQPWSLFEPSDSMHSKQSTNVRRSVSAG